MKGKIAVAIGVVITIAAFVGITSLDDEDKETPPFHVTLADPELYVNGEFSQEVRLEEGKYKFRFTPNGDSPQVLSIKISGDSFSFEEDFELKGTPHNTGISEYYTWEYLGEDTIEISNSQDLQITINPNGNLLGAVSVSLLR